MSMFLTNTALYRLHAGKIELSFTKVTPALWTSFGTLDRRKTTDLTDCSAEYDVVRKVQISHDSYTLIVQPKRKILHHFPIGYHISITAKIQGIYDWRAGNFFFKFFNFFPIQGAETTRSYTPVPISYLTIPCPISCIPLLVKSYPTGILSKFLTTDAPLATSFILSHPKGNFALQHLNNYNRFGILAAGSGITPMLRLLDYLLQRTCNKV